MLTVKACCLSVVLTEQVVGVDGSVLVAEESPYTMLLLIAHAGKALVGHLLVLLDECLGDDKVLHTVLSRIREVLGTNHAVLLHRIAHAEGWVHEYAVIAVEHLSIHATHGGADDEVGLLTVACLSQQFHSLLRNDGQVRSDDGGLWQHLADAGDGARLSTAAEAVNVKYLFAGKKIHHL